MEEGLDLGHVALLGALAVAGLAGVDAFQDAQAAKVLKNEIIKIRFMIIMGLRRRTFKLS